MSDLGIDSVLSSFILSVKAGHRGPESLRNLPRDRQPLLGLSHVSATKQGVGPGFLSLTPRYFCLFVFKEKKGALIRRAGSLGR